MKLIDSAQERETPIKIQTINAKANPISSKIKKGKVYAYVVTLKS